jgi:hypothetical protein
MAKTIRSLVDDVAAAAQTIGCDISPKDVGYIISLFLQAMAEHPDGEHNAAVDNWLLKIASECDSVTDE